MKVHMMKDETVVATNIPCIICHQHVPFTEVTAGALYADGRQAFACIEHAWNKASWLLAWARFSIAQQQEILSTDAMETPYGRRVLS